MLSAKIDTSVVGDQPQHRHGTEDRHHADEAAGSRRSAAEHPDQDQEARGFAMASMRIRSRLVCSLICLMIIELPPAATDTPARSPTTWEASSDAYPGLCSPPSHGGDRTEPVLPSVLRGVRRPRPAAEVHGEVTESTLGGRRGRAAMSRADGSGRRAGGTGRVGHRDERLLVTLAELLAEQLRGTRAGSTRGPGIRPRTDGSPPGCRRQR